MIALAAAVLAASLLAPASPDVGAARAPASLTAAPSRLALVGAAGQTIRITNSGGELIVVDVAPAGFALNLRGRPRIVPRAHAVAASWLSIRPRRLRLPPGRAASLTVSAAPPARAAPGEAGASSDAETTTAAKAVTGRSP